MSINQIIIITTRQCRLVHLFVNVKHFQHMEITVKILLTIRHTVKIKCL